MRIWRRSRAIPTSEHGIWPSRQRRRTPTWQRCWRMRRSRASRRGSPDLAAEFTSHSLRLTPADDEVAVRRRRLLQIEDLAASGEAGRALELADELLVMLPHGPDRAAVLVQRFKVEDDDLAFGERLLEEALDDAGEDEGLRGRVLDMLAWLRGVLRGNLQAGMRCRPGRDGDRRADRGRAVEDAVESSLALLQALVGDPQPELMEHALELERSIGVQGTNESPRALAGKLRFWSGDLPGARELFDEALRLAAREGNELTRPYRLYDLSLLECAAGNLAEAQELARLGSRRPRMPGSLPGRCTIRALSSPRGSATSRRRCGGPSCLHEWAAARRTAGCGQRADGQGFDPLSDGNAARHLTISASRRPAGRYRGHRARRLPGPPGRDRSVGHDREICGVGCPARAAGGACRAFQRGLGAGGRRSLSWRHPGLRRRAG